MYDDIIAELRAGGEVDLAVIADRLSESATNVEAGFNATIAEKDAAIAALETEKVGLQTHNYKLMMKVDTTNNSQPNQTSDATLEISGVKDLF